MALKYSLFNAIVFNDNHSGKQLTINLTLTESGENFGETYILFLKTYILFLKDILKHILDTTQIGRGTTITALRETIILIQGSFHLQLGGGNLSAFFYVVHTFVK